MNVDLDTVGRDLGNGILDVAVCFGFAFLGMACARVLGGWEADLGWIIGPALAAGTAAVLVRFWLLRRRARTESRTPARLAAGRLLTRFLAAAALAATVLIVLFAAAPHGFRLMRFAVYPITAVVLVFPALLLVRGCRPVEIAPFVASAGMGVGALLWLTRQPAPGRGAHVVDPAVFLALVVFALVLTLRARITRALLTWRGRACASLGVLALVAAVVVRWTNLRGSLVQDALGLSLVPLAAAIAAFALGKVLGVSRRCADHDVHAAK